MKLLGIRGHLTAATPGLRSLVCRAQDEGWAVVMESDALPALDGVKVVAADGRLKAMDLLKHRAVPCLGPGRGLMEKLVPDAVAAWDPAGAWTWIGEGPLVHH